MSRRVCFGKSGEIVYELPMLRKMSAWARFYRPLKDLFPADAYHFTWRASVWNSTVSAWP